MDIGDTRDTLWNGARAVAEVGEAVTTWSSWVGESALLGVARCRGCDLDLGTDHGSWVGWWCDGGSWERSDGEVGTLWAGGNEWCGKCEDRADAERGVEG